MDPIISSKFYLLVVQAVRLFGSETWVLTVAMMQNPKGTHSDFLRPVTGNKACILVEDNCRKEGADSVIQVVVGKPLRDYINKRQATVA